MLLRVLPFVTIVSAAAFAQSYTISTIAGGGLPVNIPGTSASLYGPESAAVDASGNVYFSDGHYVLELNAKTGIVTVVAGSGTPGYSGDNGLATGAQLNQPHGVTIDSSGSLYIADTGNQVIRKITSGVITTVAGNNTAGFSGDGGPAVNAQLFLPQGVAVDPSGNLYIADTNNNRVRIVTGAVIATFAGGGQSLGDNGPARSAQLIQPKGVATDSSANVYIADTDEGRIRKVSNGTITTVAGSGSAGFAGDGGAATNANIFFPQGIAVDSAGTLYIADTNNNRIRKVSSGTITTIGGTGTAGFGGDSGQATSAAVNLPVGVAVDASGNVYIADTNNNRIRRIATGVMTTVAGSGTTGFSGDGGPAANAQLNQPFGVAVDSSGNVYIADTGNNRIRLVSGGIITTIAGTGAAGFSGDGGSASNAQLNQPKGVAVDSSGNVFIADTGNNRIREISGGLITTIAGGGTTNGASGNATNIQLNLPQGVYVDSSDNVYIADTGNNRVRLVASRFLTTLAGTGTGGFSGEGGTPDLAQLNQPQGVYVDSSGNLYIADTNNNRIRGDTAGTIGTLIGGGTSLGDGGAPGSAELFAPRSIVLDTSSNIYIADVGDNRIRYVANASSPIISTIGGTGTAGFSGDNGPAANAQLNQPKAIAIDSSNNVYIADTANNRIRIMTSGVTPSINAGGVVPVYSTTSVVQPGEWISIFGKNLATGTYLWNNDFPTQLPEGGSSETSVTIDGIAAYLWFANPSQLNLMVPADAKTGPVSVVVTTPNGTASSTVTLAAQGPSLSLLGDNRHIIGEIPSANGTGAYGGGTYDLVGPSGAFSFVTRPVKRGEPLVLYGVGFGPTTPTVTPGQVFSGAAPTVNKVTVSIGGVQAPVVFSGVVEAGLYQINVTVPTNAPTGDQPLVATVNGAQTPTGVVVTVQ
jgi:uncharacterized protein (TIGR03437 family)